MANRVAILLDGVVGRRATCPECDGDLHACLNCRHYDATAGNECREPHAEKIVEKDRLNSCELFQLGDGAAHRRSKSTQAAHDALAALFGEAPKKQVDPKDALDALFKKG